MKYASAMKYGGELVDAVDCDYNSFKELIPLCPNCKEPVFLRTGGQRESVKGKAYQIGPHWCHFKGISKEQVAGCELRVNGYTEKDRAKIAAQARGQRLKLLQRWFWRVFSNNSSHLMNVAWPDPGLTDANDFNGSIEAVKVYLDETAYITREDLSNPDEMYVAKNYRYEIFRSFDCCIGGGNAYGEWPEDKGIEVNKRLIYTWLEIIDFLLAKTSEPLLRSVAALTESAIFWFHRNSSGGEDYDEPDTDELDIAHTIVYQICMIPWASEFQRLEAEAKQRKEAA